HIEIINFTKSSYIEYVYYLQPRAAGTFRLGPAEVRDGSKVYRSNAVTLQVRETPRSETRKDIQGEGPVFLRAEVSQKSSYVEEPVIYTVKLYRLLKVSNLSLDIPDRAALTFKKIGNPLE